MPVNTVGPDKSWRVIHDGNKIIAIFESSGFTSTGNQVFEAVSKEDAYVKAAELGLDVSLDSMSSGPGMRTLSSLQFIERFSQTTQLRIVTAAMTNPEIKLFYDKMLAADYIDLDSHLLMFGLNTLLHLGLITGIEKAEALA